MKTYIFKTCLLQRKSISRNIEISEDANLYKLAEAINDAYGFDFDHPFGFFRKVTHNWNGLAESEHYELFADISDEKLEQDTAGSVKKTKIPQVWKNIGDKMLFLFDYGDEWRFIVELIGFGEKEANIKYPRVIKQKGQAPEQYPNSE